jgi:hypothetical protein
VQGCQVRELLNRWTRSAIFLLRTEIVVPGRWRGEREGNKICLLQCAVDVPMVCLNLNSRLRAAVQRASNKFLLLRARTHPPRGSRISHEMGSSHAWAHHHHHWSGGQLAHSCCYTFPQTQSERASEQTRRPVFPSIEFEFEPCLDSCTLVRTYYYVLGEVTSPTCPTAP